MSASAPTPPMSADVASLSTAAASSRAAAVTTSTSSSTPPVAITGSLPTDIRVSPAPTTATPPSTTATVAASAGHHAHHSSPPSLLHTPTSTDRKLDVGAAAANHKGKRVFVFQKRWLHTLPIIEKTLSEPIVDSSNSSAKKQQQLSNSSAVDSDATPSTPHSPNDHTSRDVIACMLCDEPSVSHNTSTSTNSIGKFWSRLNCRRGRIENHLTSKHPEFMLLLKHKRDTEGELAVQLFLQGMRDGRCSLRNEISLGLYTHIQSLHGTTDTVTAAYTSGASLNSSTLAPTDSSVAAELKRGFPGASVYTVGREPASVGAKPVTASLLLPVYPLTPALVDSSSAKSALELLELEHRRKRARLADDAALGATGEDEGDAPDSTACSSVDASVFAQWHAVFVDRLVVVTGGDNESIASLATTLWLLGANVLLTFATLSALEAFTTRHALRFPDASGTGTNNCSSSADASTTTTATNARSVLLSMLHTFETRQQIDDWSRSVADKFARVDMLINFVDDDIRSSSANSTNSSANSLDRRTSAAVESVVDATMSDAPDHAVISVGGGTSSESLVSSANRLLALCQAISTLCFESAGAIVNITTQSNDVRHTMNCAAVESMTTSLALELEPRNVQVNCVLLQQQQLTLQAAAAAADTAQSASSSHTALDQSSDALTHTVLFLLSPAAACVSGSVVRLQHRSSVRARHAAARRESVVVETAAPVVGTEVDVDASALDTEDDSHDRENQIV